MALKSKELENHALWISTMAKRITQNALGKANPLLCLSFIKSEIQLFDSSFKIEDNLTINELKTGIPYAIVINAIEKTSSE